MAERGRPNIFRSLGRTGLKSYGGRVFEEFLPELDSRRGQAVFREMAQNDPIIHGVLFSIEQLIRKVSWRVVPFGEGNEFQRDKALIESAMIDMANTWVGTLSQLLSFLVYGWVWLEIEYKRRNGYSRDPLASSRHNDGLIGWSQWGIRSQDSLWSWEFDDATGRVTAMIQVAPPEWKPVRIPIEKSLHITTTEAKDNPEGISVLRGAYRPWYFKTAIEQIEAIGIERDVAGLPVIYAPYDLFKAANGDAGDPNTQNAVAMLESLKKIATGVKNDDQGGLLIPMWVDPDTKTPLFDFKLVASAGSRQFPTNEVIQRKSMEEASSILADFVLLGHQKYGSYALGVSKMDIFQEAISAWLDNIAAPINNHAIPELLRLNGRPTDRMPQLQHSQVKAIDVTALIDNIVKLNSIRRPATVAPAGPDGTGGARTEGDAVFDGGLSDEKVQRFIMEMLQLPGTSSSTDLEFD